MGNGEENEYIEFANTLERFERAFREEDWDECEKLLNSLSEMVEDKTMESGDGF